MEETLAISQDATWRPPAWLMAWGTAERGRWALWLPVFMMAGVAAYFALNAEPPWWIGILLLAPMIALAIACRHWPPMRALALATGFAAAGFVSAQMATLRALPTTDLPRTAVLLTGTIRGVELLPVGKRISLAFARIDGMPAPLARWVRVRLRNEDGADLATGDTVRLRALIRAPSPPAYPGGWDLQRDAFYSGLAGSGFALGRVEQLARAPPSGVNAWVQWLRGAIDAHIVAVLPGAAGAVSATLLTGLTAGIPQADRAAFRDSGLAHLLAVAGLHIGIVMGWVLVFARSGFALSEWISLRWPTKQIVAIAALIAGGAYMVLTGLHVPIIRSFAMASLFTLGVLAGRRGVSLRGLALAAIVLMLVSPQEVVGVSFQMSFSAVLALIAGYDALRPWLRTLRARRGWHWHLLHHVTLLALTSLLAGTASAPYGAYHFGHIQLYFILANMAAVPITALWVMPLGLVALALMPLGAEWVALVPMGWGVEAILWIARATSALPAATLDVPHMPQWGLVLVSLGIAWLGLWRSLGRLLGIPILTVGLISPLWVRPPDILVSADARLVGMRTGEGVFVAERARADKFTLESWEQYWAVGRVRGLDDAPDDTATCEDGACLLRPREGRAAALLLEGETANHPWCPEAAVVLSAEPARGRCPRPWPRPWPPLVDRFTVWRTGSQAIWMEPDGVVVLSDREARGNRPWVLVPKAREPGAAQEAIQANGPELALPARSNARRSRPN